MAEKIKMTKAGFDDLNAELKEYINVRRPDAAQKIKEARGYGDLSENAEYDAAKEEQASIEYHIKELQDKIQNAVIIGDDEITDDAVSFGSYVKIYHKVYDEVMVYRILGTSEADITQNIISEKSPLAAALLGQKKGATVTVTTPRSSFQVKIMDISRNKIEV